MNSVEKKHPLHQRESVLIRRELFLRNVESARRTCSVCRAEASVLETVNHGFATNTPVRVLARDCGFSEPALAKHKRYCLSRAMLKHWRTKRIEPAQPSRQLLANDDGTFTYRDPEGGECKIGPGDLEEGDVIFRIIYKEHPITNRHVRPFTVVSPTSPKKDSAKAVN